MTTFPNISGRPSLRVVARRFSALGRLEAFPPYFGRSGSVLGRSSFPSGEA